MEKRKKLNPRPEPAVPVAIPEPPKRLITADSLASLEAQFCWNSVSCHHRIFSPLASAAATAETTGKTKEMSFKRLTSYSWDNPLDSAAISPDGKYLAFCSRGKLFVQVIRSGEKRSVRSSGGVLPNESRLVSRRNKLLLSRIQEQWAKVKEESTWQTDFSIWSLSMLGGKPQNIVDHADGYAAVSPNGSLVAIDRFDSDRQAREIWLAGSNGEELRKLKIGSQAGPPAGAHNPSFGGAVWSPNGQRLLYFRTDDLGQPTERRSIESCDLRGEQISTFSSPSTDVCVPHWTTDGRVMHLLDKKELEGSGTTVNLWEIKVDGTGKPLSEARRLHPVVCGFGFSTAGYLSITADGKQVVVLRAQCTRRRLRGGA